MAATVKFVLSIVVDIAIFVLVGVSAILMRQFCAPFERGFFRNDESLMHPFRPSTITSATLYAVGFIIPITTIIAAEVFFSQRFRSHKQPAGVSRRKECFISCFNIIATFFFGAACTHLLTDIPKYTIGRLRPHFFDVCKPNWDLLNSTSGFVTADICTGTDLKLMKEARLSFPSGHSSMAMYCAFFFILYLKSKIAWKDVRLIVPLIQVIAFSMAFYTCLSRISDYKHHWSDVLAGGVLGIALAFPCFSLVKTPSQLKKPGNDESIPL